MNFKSGNKFFCLEGRKFSFQIQVTYFTKRVEHPSESNTPFLTKTAMWYLTNN